MEKEQYLKSIKTKSMLSISHVKQYIKGIKEVRVSKEFIVALDGIVRNEINRAVRNVGSKKTLTDKELIRYTKQ